MELIHKVAVKVLDVSYVLKSRLTDLLSYATDNNESISVSNHFLLAACVIVAASYIIDANSNDIVSSLSVEKSRQE